jgi:hypothetical protein
MQNRTFGPSLATAHGILNPVMDIVCPARSEAECQDSFWIFASLCLQRHGPDGRTLSGFPKKVREGFVVGLDDTLQQLQDALEQERGIYLTGHGAQGSP